MQVPPGLLIFNDIRLRGFWLTGGYAKVRCCAGQAPQGVSRAAAAGGWARAGGGPHPVDCRPAWGWGWGTAAHGGRLLTWPVRQPGRRARVIPLLHPLLLPLPLPRR